MNKPEVWRELAQLDDQDLKAIARCAMTGGNELAQLEGQVAREILELRTGKAPTDAELAAGWRSVDDVLTFDQARGI